MKSHGFSSIKRDVVPTFYCKVRDGLHNSEDHGKLKQVSRVWARFLELGARGCLWQEHLDGEAVLPGEFKKLTFEMLLTFFFHTGSCKWVYFCSCGGKVAAAVVAVFANSAVENFQCCQIPRDALGVFVLHVVHNGQSCA